jgi:hypothetical protein
LFVLIVIYITIIDYTEFNKKNFQNAQEETSNQYTIGSSDKSDKSLSRPWVGVDLDGTLAHYDENSSIELIEEPIPAMVEFIRKMIQKNIQVKIFTARASDADQLPIIREWLKDYDLSELEITNFKDYQMTKLYDDRCVQVEKNTGQPIGK